MKRVENFGSKVFLVNTGWTGGPYGIGKRFDIPTTRRIVNAVQNGELDDVETQMLNGLNLEVPLSIQGVDSNLLNPRETWEDKGAYDAAAADLIKLFQNNFERFDVSEEIISAGPSDQ